MATVRQLPTIDDIRAAAGTIAGHVHRTPVFTSATLSRRVGAPVWLKAEQFQRAGSFKTRGAFNRFAALTPQERERGVITVSAGNHGQAVALAAREFGVDALVLMPRGASTSKVAATRGYGATIDFNSRDTTEAYGRLAEISHSTGRLVVHPFDDPLVIAGQGTIGLELLEQVPGLDTVIVPVGGGGLLAGIATAVRALRPGARLVGVEPRATATLTPALREGHPVQVEIAPTAADALSPPRCGDLPFEICRRLVDDVVLVEEEEIRDAVRFLFERSKLVAEAGGAVALAALLAGRLDVAGAGGVAVVISGGNIAPELACELLAERS